MRQQETQVSMRRRVRPFLIGAGMALLAACGTTVPITTTVAGAPQDAASGVGPAVGGNSGTAGDLGGSSSSGPRAGGYSVGRSGSPGRSQAASSLPATTAKAPAGRRTGAVPKAPVEVGIWTVDLGDAIAAASSAGNCDASCVSAYGGVSQNAMANGVVDWVNAHGGLAGHPLKLVNHVVKTADVETQGASAVSAQTCADWTQDHHVSALVLQGVIDEMYACAVRHRLPVINDDYANYVPDRQDLKGVGQFNYASANFNLDDTAKYYVNALGDQGFLKPGNKVGLIYKESPVYQRVIKNTLVPELVRRGLKLDATASWNESSTQADWNNYVLHFNSQHVDRVLIFGGWNFGMANFAKTAETQQYHPRYGVSSISGPNSMEIDGVPKSQLKGAQGVGWWTFSDVLYQGDVARFNPAAAECKKIMIAAGQPWNPETYVMGMKFCDGFFLLKTLADRAGAVGQSAFYSAADHLGSAFTSPYMWKTNFRPGDHNAAVYLRNLAYDEPCDCFKYVGDKYLPRW